MQSAEDIAKECPTPQLLPKTTFKSLGKPTVQAHALANDETHLSPEQLPAAAQQRHKELEDAREID